MGIGAVLVGPLTDRFGRRKSLITSVAMFSLFTIATGLAQSVGQFTTFRFLAGLGLGGCLPTALAFMSEHAPTGRGGSAITRMMTGYHVGAVLSALLALWMVEDYGWRSMFVVGGALGLLTLPFMWAKLPESAAYLRAVERRDRSAAGTLARSADVVKGRYLRISIGLCVASFMGLLLVYGLNTWLPTIMRDAGYSIQQGTTLILVLNVGAVIGLLVAGHFSDTRGNKPAVLAWFTLAAVFLGAPLDQDGEPTSRVRRGTADGHLRVQRPGTGLCVRRSPLPTRDPRHRSRRGGRGRTGGSDRGPLARRHTGDGRGRLPVGFLRIHAGGRPRRAHSGYSSGARERRRLTFDPQRGVPVSGRLPCMAGNSSHPGASVTSRVLALLDAFDEDHRRLALTELAARPDLPLPTAHRLVGELAGWGALDRDTFGQYVIGRRLWDLGLLAPLQAGLVEIASPYLHDLYGATLATVHLAVRDGHEVLYLDRVRGHASVPIVSTVGSRLPMHATGVGKVLLAHAPVDVQHRVLAELSRITPYTITQPGIVEPSAGTGAA